MPAGEQIESFDVVPDREELVRMRGEDSGSAQLGGKSPVSRRNLDWFSGTAKVGLDERRDETTL